MLKAGDMFDGLNPEDEQEIDRKVDVKKNSALERMMNSNQKYHEIIDLYKIGERTFADMEKDYPGYYELAEILIPKDYTSRDITLFSIIFQDIVHPEWDIGYYISALINHSNESDFTYCSNGNTGNIGFRNNGKRITVLGDVDDQNGAEMTEGELIIKGNNFGEYLGCKMTGGSILLEGSSFSCTGSGMTGGKIIVNGDSTAHVGDDMKGGEIVIGGHAGESVGSSMTGGTIHLNGDYKSLSDDIHGGDIYHKGKLIVKDGGLVE
jgi:hypothetical protein